MADNIVNRVAASALITFDLENYIESDPDSRLIYPNGWIKDYAKRKEFRAQLKAHDWSIYLDKFMPYNVLLKPFYPHGLFYWLRPTYNLLPER